MRNFVKFLAIALSLISVACTKEANSPIDNQVTITFHANEVETKTTFGTPEGTTYPVLWQTGDKVKVYADYASVRETTVSPSTDFKSATFSYSGTAAKTIYSAIYPSTSAKGYTESSSSFKILVPLTQTPTATSVDPSAQILYGSCSAANGATSLDMNFSHVVAYGKMTLTNLPSTISINKVTLSSESHVMNGNINFFPTATTKISPVDGSGDLNILTTSSNDIWFSCLPHNYTSGEKLKVKVSTTDGLSYTKEITFGSNPLTFTAGRISGFSVNFTGITPEGGETPTGGKDILKATNLAATNTTYTDFFDISITNGSGAKYAGRSAKHTSGAIQLNATNPNGIVTTKSGGLAKMVIVTWNDATADGRKIDIYGKNTAYTSATDLYNADLQGTYIGSITNGSTYLDIESDYKFIGLRSNASALYLDNITFTWSDLNGNIPTTEPQKLSAPQVSCTTQYSNSLVFSWGEVTNAVGYQVSTNGGSTWSETITDTEYTWNSLSPSTSYTLYVKAIGDGGYFTDSDAATAQGTTEAQSSSSTPVTVKMTSFSAISGNVDGDVNVTYTSAKGGGTTDPGVYSNEIRLYHNSTGTGGGYITIEAKNGKTINSITIGSSMATSVAYSEGSPTATKSANQSISANGTYTYTPSSTGVTSVTFHCMGTAKTARLQVNKLEVTYR